MKSKFFPVKTKTACQLKWNWSTLYLYKGTTASCHRTGSSEISVENFNQFHNTGKKQSERTKMLQGLWPENSCGYCQSIEDVGGYSDRMLHLSIPNVSPPELETDPSAVVVTPTLLEVYFDNTCNMSCLYCHPSLSSKINQEHKKFGEWRYKNIELASFSPHPDHSALLEKFWIWMHNNSHKLKRLQILGGEPFYQDEYYKLLDYFEYNPHPNLEFNLVTNLMVEHNRFGAMIDRWRSLLSRKHLKRIDVTCSIDCWGIEQEYVRYGLHLDQWQKNFEKLLEQKWLTVNINQTISVLTIKTMPDLLKRLIQWRHRRPIGHYFSEISPGPEYLMPQILGGGIFDQDFENILALMPSQTDQDCRARSYMQGISTHIASSVANHNAIDNLRHFLDEKDRRRGTSWKKTFPWLIKEIDHVV